MPVLACLPPFVMQLRADKVDCMKTPQQLSREAIEEFKAIYQEEFGKPYQTMKCRRSPCGYCAFSGF
jgi:hypothetical protein